MSKYAKEFPFTKKEVAGKIKLDLSSYNIKKYFYERIGEAICEHFDNLPVDFIKAYVAENAYLKIEHISPNNQVLYGTVYCKFNNLTFMTNEYVFDNNDVLIIFIKKENGKWSKEFIYPEKIYNMRDLLVNKIFKIKYQARRK